MYQSRIRALEECRRILFNMDKTLNEQYKIVKDARKKVRFAIKNNGKKY